MELLNEDKFADLVNFIRKQVNEYIIPIKRETLIEDDLGVTGDEAEELIFNFSTHYKVDLKFFTFTKYFYDEPGAFNFSNRAVSPFTVRDMERAIILGRLDDEILNETRGLF